MADIIKSAVSKAFASARDIRINYHIVDKGASSLLTGIYDPSEDQASKFYSKPDITGDGSVTKLAVIYGENMITPYLVDAGVESSTNDPSSILKTYRFILGDGETEGIVPGPNGSQLENVYIVDPNAIPQPVVNSDGRPSVANVLLASALGAAITSAPKIWDAIKGAAPAASKTTTVDPITGKALTSKDAQNSANIAKQIPLGQLSDVDDAAKGDNTVLTYDPETGTWIAKKLSVILAEEEALAMDGACGGAGGAGGGGGAGGDGGNGGGTPAPDPAEECEPASSFVEYPCLTPPAATKSGMVLLPAISNTTSNQYTQTIPAVGTKGIEFHFYASGNGKKAIWKVDAGDTETCDPGSTYACFVDPTKEEVQRPTTSGAEVPYMEAASFKIKLCLTTNICGSEYLIYTTSITETALSKSSYTFIGATVNWVDTKIGPLLTKYPGQIFNSSNPNVKVYLYRTDECDSEYDLFFEGYKRLIGETYFPSKQSPKTSQAGTTAPKPATVQVKADDGRFPDEKPAGGGMGLPSCPEDIPIPTDPTAGTPGTPGVPGTAGEPPECGTVAVSPPKAQPTLILKSISARQYGTKTTPPAFDAVALPQALINTKIVDQNVSLVYSMVTGDGVFSIAGAIPGTVTAFPTSNPNQLLLTGPKADVETASLQVRFTPAENSGGEINYKVVLTNAEGSKAGTTAQIMPIQIVIKDNQAASAKVCVDASSSGGTGKVKVTFNGKTLDLTLGFVAFNTNPTITAAAIASNINGNVAFQNALPATDDAWLPNFNAVASGNEVTITAPVQGGADFNGVKLTTEVTTGFVFGDCVGSFLGGITKTISDFVKNNTPSWESAQNALLGIGASVLGAVASNMILNKTSSLQISIPTNENVDVVFLYRGRIVSVPNEYDGLNRTGHPSSYDTWSGVWKKQYTNNPAWCLYDYITNKNYGLGLDIILNAEQEEELLRDLFKIGYYCDDTIYDDAGAPLKRFSTNTVITDGTKLQILEQLCSVFLGGYLFPHGGLRITIDKPDADIKFLVTQANAGGFEKILTTTKNFVNKVKLTYIEPSSFYTQEVVVAEDDTAIDLWGERSISTVAFGCTNATQAKNYAAWILKSEIENSVNISYNAGFDHYALIGGDIVEFYDSNQRRAERRSGRIKSNTGNAVVLDAPIVAVVGDYFSLTLSNGTVFQTTIATISGVNVTLTDTPPIAALNWATFIAASQTTGRKLYKVIKHDEVSTAQFAITLQLYNPDKY